MAFKNTERSTFTLKIDGKEVDASLRDIEARAKAIKSIMSKSTDPAEIQKYKSELDQVNKKLSDAREHIFGAKKGSNELVGALKEVAVAAGIALSVEKVVEFVKAGIEGAMEIERINKQVYNQLVLINKESEASADRLANQAESLSGLFKDEEIKKVQLYFAQFGLGSSYIEKAIPVLMDFAAGTGKSLDEASTIFTKGIEGQGKALKEYGIILREGATEQENFNYILDQMGSKFKGQTDLISQSSEGSVKKLSNLWDEFGERVGGFFLPAVTGFTNWASSILSTKTEVEKLTDSYDKLKAETEALESKTNPLIDRIDELQGKTNLSTNEQKELKSAIEQVGIEIPTAVTKFDAYGKAISISTKGAREFIDAQKELLRVSNSELIQKQTEKLMELNAEYKNTQEELNKKSRTVFSPQPNLVSPYIEVRLTPAELTERTKKTEELHKAVIDTYNSIQLLSGEKVVTKEAAKETKENIDLSTKSLAELQKLLESDPHNVFILAQIDRLKEGNVKLVELRKKMLEDLKKFEDETLKIRQQTADLRISQISDESERELASLRNKYEQEQKDLENQKVNPSKGKSLSSAEIDRNNAVNDALLELNKNYLKAVEDLYLKANKELADKEYNQDIHNLDQWLKTRQLSIQKDRASGSISEEQYQSELNDIQLQYLTLKLKNYQDYGKDTVDIEKQIQELIIKTNDDTLKKLLKNHNVNLDKLSDQQRKKVAELIQQLSVLLASGADLNSQAVQDILNQLDSFAQKTGDKWKSVLKGVMDYVGEFANAIANIWDSANQIADNADRKRLAQLHKNSEAERSVFAKLLKDKRISQSEHDKEVDKLNKAEEAANRKAEREGAIRNQKAAVFKAEINALQAISATLAQYPWPFNIAFAAITAFAAYKQVEAIKSEPLPELGDGGIIKGDKHSDPSRGVTVKLEDGELVGSARFVEKNPELAAAIAAASKGTGDLNFPKYMNRSFSQINLPAAISATEPLYGRAVANYDDSSTTGSVSRRSSSGSSSTADNSEFMKLLIMHKDAVEKLNQTLEKGIDAKLSYRPFKKELNRLDAITGGNP